MITLVTIIEPVFEPSGRDKQRKKVMDYSNFKVEDFVADEYFLRWVKRPDEQSNAFWNAWLSKNPGSAGHVRAAQDIVLNLDFKPNIPPEGKFLEVWDKIAKAESESGDFPSPSMVTMRPSQTAKNTPDRRWIYGIAAMVSLVVVALYLVIGPQSDKNEISTAYGESRTVSLPDSTRVTLNSNSRISFSPSVGKGVLEVTLEGEAFFSVTHKNDREKFVVHTEELSIEVMGTKFNVNTRRGNTKVILKEGKVRLNMGDKKQEDVVMTPGEYVEFTSKGELTRKVVEADNYLEWRNNRLIFVGTSLEEIGQLLEDNYGYEVVFESDSIKQKEFTGSSSAVEIEELLEKLSRVYDLEIKKTGNKVTLKQNKGPVRR